MMLRRQAGEARYNGRIEEAHQLFMESTRAYIRAGKVSDKVLSETFAAKAYLYGNEFERSEKMLELFGDPKSEYYIREPYQLEYISWYCTSSSGRQTTLGYSVSSFQG